MKNNILFIIILLLSVGMPLAGQTTDYSREIIDSAVVVAKNDLIKATNGGYDVLIPGNFNTNGKSSLDILKVLPGIKYDSGSLSMTGKDGLKIYIDDLEVRMTGTQLQSYLKAMPADNLKKVSIFFSPTAKEDSEGDIGVVRISTKSYYLSGLKGSLTAEWGRNSYSSYMGSAYLAYSFKRFFGEMTISSDAISYLNKTEYSSLYTNGTVHTYNPKKWDKCYTDAKINFGYKPNDKSRLIFSASIPFFHKETITDIDNTATYYTAGRVSADSSLVSKGVSTSYKSDYDFGVYYDLEIADSLNFSVASDCSRNVFRNTKSFLSEAIAGAMSYKSENFFSKGLLDYRVYTIKADVVFPIKRMLVRAGGKLSFINTSTEDSYIHNTVVENTFDYQERIQAVYAQIEREFDKFSYKIGLRGEFTQANYAYQNLFPYLSFSQNFGKKRIASISYSRRINRPSYKLLDPFKWYLTKYSYSVGNPLLRPSYSDNLSLSYSSGDTFRTMLYAERETGKVGKLVLLSDNEVNVQAETANNYLTEESVGLMFYKSFKPFDRYAFSIQGNAAINRYFSNKEEFENKEGVMCSLYMFNSLNIGRNFNIEATISESLPGLYAYRERENSFRFDIGLTYAPVKYKFSVNLIISDIFKTADSPYTYKSGGVTQLYHNYYDTRSLLLSFRWNFGQLKSNIQKPVKSNTEETKRAD